MLHRTISASLSGRGARTARLPGIHSPRSAELRRRMSSENRPPDDPQSPFRRNLLLGSAALSATALLPPFALAQQFPTAKVNTTGLAVTDTDVTVSILHSVTGTMAISETGSRS